MSSGTTTLTLYNASEEQVRKTTDVLVMNVPGQDSDQALAFDLFGVRREIMSSGIVTRTDVADLWKFAYDITGLKQTVASVSYDTLVNGAQGNTGSSTVGYTYTSRVLTDGDTPNATDGLRQITVYCTDASVRGVAGEGGSLYYNVTLVEINSSSG